MSEHFDVAVVGGGIVGLAHARIAVQRGLSVALFERSRAAQGASVRNFGMIWPIGQPAGELYQLALNSRRHWLQLDAEAVVEAERCGSIHLAHRKDELAVLTEFCDAATHEVQMLGHDDVLRQAPMANPEGLLAGLQSATELRVDPRTASAKLAQWLAEQPGCECHFQTLIRELDQHRLFAADGRSWSADRIVICSGSDLQTLRPDVLRDSGLKLCKLQMLRAAAQHHLRCVPHLASGLTLRHYTAFADCPSIDRLRERVRLEAPELDRFGIHVMASQHQDRTVILGDSHEYEPDIDPFDKTHVNSLIIRELQKIIRLDDWTIDQGWHGIYAKHPELPSFEADLPDGVHVFTGSGGAGMTMSFGLAERAWNRWLGNPS